MSDEESFDKATSLGEESSSSPQRKKRRSRSSSKKDRKSESSKHKRRKRSSSRRRSRYDDESLSDESSTNESSNSSEKHRKVKRHHRKSKKGKSKKSDRKENKKVKKSTDRQDQNSSHSDGSDDHDHKEATQHQGQHDPPHQNLLTNEKKSLQNQQLNLSEKTDSGSQKDQSDLAQRSRMAPMSREQYEKQQSIIREVYDEESGRWRLVRGSGEIIERIVSRDDHQRINQRATQGDGSSFSRHIYNALHKR